jgi:hypothetical protein
MCLLFEATLHGLLSFQSQVSRTVDLIDSLTVLGATSHHIFFHLELQAAVVTS